MPGGVDISSPAAGREEKDFAPAANQTTAFAVPD